MSCNTQSRQGSCRATHSCKIYFNNFKNPNFSLKSLMKKILKWKLTPQSSTRSCIAAVYCTRRHPFTSHLLPLALLLCATPSFLQILETAFVEHLKSAMMLCKCKFCWPSAIMKPAGNWLVNASSISSSLVHLRCDPSTHSFLSFHSLWLSDGIMLKVLHDYQSLR